MKKFKCPTCGIICDKLDLLNVDHKRSFFFFYRLANQLEKFNIVVCSSCKNEFKDRSLRILFVFKSIYSLVVSIICLTLFLLSINYILLSGDDIKKYSFLFFSLLCWSLIITGVFLIYKYFISRNHKMDDTQVVIFNPPAPIYLLVLGLVLFIIGISFLMSILFQL